MQDTLFIVPAILSDELALTREGDRVELEYGENTMIPQATAFDNLEFIQK